MDFLPSWASFCSMAIFNVGQIKIAAGVDPTIVTWPDTFRAAKACWHNTISFLGMHPACDAGAPRDQDRQWRPVPPSLAAGVGGNNPADPCANDQ